MSKAISEKIKEMLTPKDLKIFEAAIEKMIEKRVALKEEEMKNKYDELAEEYVSKKVKELVENEKANLIESYDSKLKNIEKNVVTKLGSFLDHVITEQISDSSIEKLAINEVAYPIVEKIMKVFSENYVELDSDGSKALKVEQKKVIDLEKQLSEAHGKIMESEERLEKSATFLLISEKTAHLTNTQKARVLKMFKSKKFEDVQENIGTFVEMIKESSEPKIERKKEKGTIDEIISESDSIPEAKPVIVESEDNNIETFATKANRYLVD
jgi:hypothetical protein